MKKTILLTLACVASLALKAQTLNVNIGDVTYAIPASQAGEMLYENGTTLTIGNKTYSLNEITNITVDEQAVEANTIDVNYSEAGAKVRISGDVAAYITARVNGAHVTIDASPNLAQEITYNLGGSSQNGSFYMTGSYKMELALNDLVLANPDSAAINIQNGKQTKVKINGTNSLTDGLRGVDDDSDGHKAVFYIDGHSEWNGSGKLTITGNVKHGLSTDEYVEIKKNFGTLVINGTPGDGLHINQYFQMKGGNVSITAVGDGIDVGAKKSEKENNGQIIIEGGDLQITVTGDAVKGLKCETDMSILGGTITINTSGDAVYEESEQDLSSCAAVKCDGILTISGGTLWLASTGAGGKGINADGAININGGNITVVTTGEVHEYGSLDSKPQAVKSDGNITLAGGEILSCASQHSGTAFKTDYQVLTNGATVMGIGGKATTAANTSTCTSNKYSGVNVQGGSTISYDGVSFVIPEIYNNPSAKIMVSKKD